MAKLTIKGFIEKVEDNTIYLVGWSPQDELFEKVNALNPSTGKVFPPTAERGRYLRVRRGKLTNQDIIDLTGYEITIEVRLTPRYYQKTNTTSVVAEFYELKQ